MVILACQIVDSSVSLAECARLFRPGCLGSLLPSGRARPRSSALSGRVLGSTRSDLILSTGTTPISSTVLARCTQRESLHLKSKTFPAKSPFLMEPVSPLLRFERNRRSKNPRAEGMKPPKDPPSSLPRAFGRSSPPYEFLFSLGQCFSSQISDVSSNGVLLI